MLENGKDYHHSNSGSDAAGIVVSSTSASVGDGVANVVEYLSNGSSRKSSEADDYQENNSCGTTRMMTPVGDIHHNRFMSHGTATHLSSSSIGGSSNLLMQQDEVRFMFRY